MSTTEVKKPAAPSKPAKGKSLEEIYNGFNLLRSEQRALINKLCEIEMDLNEHQMVYDTLKDLDGDRKCFRLIGGVLTEKTVKDILPTIKTNIDQLSLVVETLNKEVQKKGEELLEYKQKNDIKVKDENMPNNSEESKPKQQEALPRSALMVNPI